MKKVVQLLLLALAVFTLLLAVISPNEGRPSDTSSQPRHLTPLQRHVAFWDSSGDGIITTQEIYTGFRSLGFSIPYSLAGLLINVFFSYPTRLGHSYIPDPWFRIYIDSIHKAKHGSDTGVYDSDGTLREPLFHEMFDKLDSSGKGSLGISDILTLLRKDRVAADPAGWTFAVMEWGTTWLLLQKGGRVGKDDLMQCYDGSLFYRIREARMEGEGWQQGYGWKECMSSLWTNRKF